MTVTQCIFYIFSAILLGGATMVIVSKNTVRSALFLILSFVTCSALWLLLQAEFLGLVLIFVYVGAVMTLFLFVVMMLNVTQASRPKSFYWYMPLAAIVTAVITGITYMVVVHAKAKLAGAALVQHSAQYSNIKSLGAVLYTDYMLPFELAAALLLVGIIAAITLSFRGRQHSKSQNISVQLSAKKADRLRIIKDMGV